MKAIYKYIILIICFITLSSLHITSWAQQKNNFELSNTSVPVQEIIRGGPTKDIIPILTNPDFFMHSKVTYMNDGDKLLGVFTDGVAKAYPIKMLNYHEFINDRTHRKSYVICFCPLCGTGYALKMFSTKIANTFSLG